MLRRARRWPGADVAASLCRGADRDARFPRRTARGSAASSQRDWHDATARRRLTQIMHGDVAGQLSGFARVAVLLAAIVLPLQPVLRAAPVLTANRDIASKQTPALVIPSEILRPVVGDVAGTTGSTTRPVAPSGDDAWAEARSATGRFIVSARGQRVLFEDTVAKSSVDLTPFGVKTVAFTPSGLWLVTGGVDRLVRIWDCAKGTVEATLPAFADAVRAVALSANGRTLAVATADGEISTWDLVTRQRLGASTRIESPNSLAFSADDAMLAVAVGDWMDASAGQVVLLDGHSLARRSNIATGSPVGAVAFQPGTGNLIAGEWSGKVTWWNAGSGETFRVRAAVQRAVVVPPFAQ